jgi:transposase
MEHVGIDLGSRKSHAVRLSRGGELLERAELLTTEIESWLGKLAPSRVVMEACTQSPALARIVRRLGHEAVVIPGTAVRALGVGARGIKTDHRDAEVLARASVRNESLPSVHLRSEQATAQREHIATRCRLVKMRTQTACSIKSALRGRLLPVRGRASSKGFTDSVRAQLLETQDGIASHIEALLTTFEFLTEQIVTLDEQVRAMAAQSEPCKKLMTVPGVGPLVSLSFASTIDDVTRFETADEVGSFLALAPGESTTGGKIRRTGTLRAGPVWLKALLVQAAWSMWRTTPQAPMVLWARAIADKRGKRIAIVALARKLATVMWSMWKHDQVYRPSAAASMKLQLATSVHAEQMAAATIP